MDLKKETVRDSDLVGSEQTNELHVETRHPVEGRVVQVVDARSYIARSLGIMGLVGVALIHLLDSGSQLKDTPYIFWLYVALMIASLVTSAALLHAESRFAWIAAGGLAGLTMLGFILSRTVGLPYSTGDIGNWGDQLGMASLFIEGCVVALAIYRLVLIRPARQITP